MKAENRFGLQSLAAFNIFSGFKSVSILIFFNAQTSRQMRLIKSSIV